MNMLLASRWLVLLLVVVTAANAHGQDVLTQRDNNARTGVYIQPGLNPASFAPANDWGRLGSLPVDAAVYAQPLYVSSLAMPIDGRQHNVMYIATARNTVYAFDAAPPFTQLWMTPLGPPDDSDSKEMVIDCHKNLVPIQTLAPIDLDDNSYGAGIMSTPVIDRATQRLYVSYRTLQRGMPEQHIAALSLTTGRRSLNDHIIGPSEIRGDIRGLWQRASLLLSNGLLYVAFAAHSENPCLYQTNPWLRYRGQLLVFDAEARQLQWLGNFVPVTPGPHATRWGGGIWQASSGLAADENGDVYFAVGNAMTFPDHTDDLHADPTSLANAVIRVHPVRNTGPGGQLQVSLEVVDWFMPYRSYWHNKYDFDLGSAGPVLVPNTHHLLVGGKEGLLYVLDRNNLGQLDQDQAHAWETNGLESLKYPQQPPQDLPGTPRDQIQYCFPPPQPTSPRYGTQYRYAADDPMADHVRDPGRTDFQKIQVGQNFSIPDPRMDCWIVWPHIHGTPVYADFPNSRSFFYVWPEKDHLKAYARQSDAVNLKFVETPALADGVAPVPFGMPGGMLAMSQDPNSTGVLFASVSMELEDMGVPNGILHAFDPIPDAHGTLHELWNNLSDSYFFAKFVPPTIAGGRVYLATFSKQVLVYGPGSPEASTGNVVPHSHIGAVLQDPSQDQITAMLVDAHGALRVFWEEHNEPWHPQNQAVLSVGDLAPPGAPVTLAFEPDGRQLDAFVVGNDGAVYMLSDVVPAPWTAPMRLTPAGFAPIGAKIATLVQGFNTFDAFVVGTDGAIHVLWNVAHQGWSNAWISAPGTVAAGGRNVDGRRDCAIPPGCAAMATGDYRAGELDLVTINLQGAFCVFKITLVNPQTNRWSPWSGPFVYGPAQNDTMYRFPPNADVVAAKQFPDQLDAFVVGNDGRLNVMWIKDGADWRRNAISAPGFAPPGANLGVSQHGTDRLDTFVVGNDGALSVFSSLNGRYWSLIRAGEVVSGNTRTPSYGVAVPGTPIGVSLQRSTVGTEVLDALIAGYTGVSVSFAVNPQTVSCNDPPSPCPYPPHGWSRPYLVLR